MAANQIQLLTDYSERLLRQTDSAQCAPETATHELLRTLLKAPGQWSRGPSHAFVGHEEGEWISGFLYRASMGDLIRDEELLQISSRSHYAVTRGREHAVYANAPSDPNGLDRFQQQFHPSVRAQIGCIRNYATYRFGPLALILFNYPGRADAYDAQVLKVLTSYASTLQTIMVQRDEIDHAFRYTVTALARASEVNDEDTGNHILRVGRYAECLAAVLGQPETFVQTIGYSAQLHDVGKIHLDRHVLQKTGPLTKEELAQMREHPIAGALIIGEAPRLAMAREIALSHHERWDGSGYPLRLEGEQIPLSGRITALADVYDALRNPRCYKPAFSHRHAMQIILEGDGRVQPCHFDPRVLEAFRTTAEKFEAIYESLLDEPDRKTSGWRLRHKAALQSTLGPPPTPEPNQSNSPTKGRRELKRRSSSPDSRR